MGMEQFVEVKSRIVRASRASLRPDDSRAEASIEVAEEVEKAEEAK